ncbi:MAG: hypothetical protein ACKOD5_08290 [Chthoniobacterales bacterium]
MTSVENETSGGFGDIPPRDDGDAQLVALMLRVREDDEAAFRELVEATGDRL